MRILHIIQRYWPARGGAETLLGAISEYLVAQGHDVTVATTDALDFELFWDPRRRRVDTREAVHNGVRILRFPVRHVPLPQLAYPGIRRLLWMLSMAKPVPVTWMARLSRFTPWVPGLWRWLKTTGETFNLVAGMTICFEPLLEAGLRFSERRGIPYVIYPLTHLGAGPVPGDDALSRFYTMRHQQDLVMRSTALVAQTASERDFYVQRGFERERALVAGPGITPGEVLGGDGARFRRRHGIAEATPLVVALSSMSYDKGTPHVVEAVRRLWQQGRDVELALAGAVLTPFRRYLDGLPPAERERVRLLGPVGEDEKRDLLAAADVVAMSSRTDSFGIVYLEAWLYAKPVIGARTWGVTDVIDDGVDGRLVPFGDVDTLAETLVQLIDHPEIRAAMGAQGARKVLAQHTWARKHRTVYARYCELAGLVQSAEQVA